MARQSEKPQEERREPRPIARSRHGRRDRRDKRAVPLAHRDIPEDTITNLLAWGPTFLVIGAAGWCAYPRDGMRRGCERAAWSRFSPSAVPWPRFAIVENVFLHLVCQQPEKIWLLQQSGYGDMRMAINAGHLHALLFVLPVLTGLGVLTAGVGGIVAKHQRAR